MGASRRTTAIPDTTNIGNLLRTESDTHLITDGAQAVNGRKRALQL